MSFITVIIDVTVVVFEVIAQIICLASLDYYYGELSFNHLITPIRYLSPIIKHPTIHNPTPIIITPPLPPYTNNPPKSFLTNKFSISKNIFLIDCQLILPTFLVYQ